MSSYQVFARKYRPRTFDDILGQDHVVRTLRNAVEQDRIAQAYLFVGPRGTGKTSTARILAKALNCPGGPRADFDPDDELCVEIAEGRALDVMEIDGASNNSVDNVRELRDTVKYSPVRAKYKIYYIDEVHMLSTQAFNALLKTLEEPPPHVKFIFATTEAHKVLPTILSRCQRFDLRPIPASTIATHLLHVAKQEGINLSAEAAQTIARGADGGMRDAQSMLDQLVAFCGNTIEEHHAVEVFGFTSAQTIGDLAGRILRQDTAGALSLIHGQHEGGRDLQNLLGEILTFFRNLLVLTIDPKNVLPDVTPEGRRLLQSAVGLAPNDRLLGLIDHLAGVQDKMRWAPNKKLHFEMGAVKAVQLLQEVSLTDVVNFLRDAAEGTEPPALPVATAAKPDGMSTRVPASPLPSTHPAEPAPATPAKPPVVAAPAPPAPEPASKAETPAKPEAGKKPANPSKPEPKPKPAATPQPALTPEATWSAAVALLAEEGGGFAAMSAGHVTVIGMEDDVINGALPRSREVELHLILEFKEELERCLRKVSGRGLRFTVDLNDDLPDIPDGDETPDLFTVAGEDDSPPPPGPLSDDDYEPDDDNDAPLPSAGASVAASASAAPEPPEPDLESPEDFYNDPLIQKALAMFEGEILKDKAP